MQPEYIPSPEEIAEQTAMIRAGWSDDDHIKRRRCKVNLIDCDFEQVHRDALAKLATRLTKHERPVVVDDLSRRGDPVPFEFEPLPLG